MQTADLGEENDFASEDAIGENKNDTTTEHEYSDYSVDEKACDTEENKGNSHYQRPIGPRNHQIRVIAEDLKILSLNPQLSDRVTYSPMPCLIPRYQGEICSTEGH